MALTSLGPVFGISGAPRGLGEAAQAVGAIAWIREQGWGPAQSRGEQRWAWAKLRRCGIVEPPEWPSEEAS
eukprot:10933039-Alexandrium_andersonii.AAC.1